MSLADKIAKINLSRGLRLTIVATFALPLMAFNGTKKMTQAQAAHPQGSSETKEEKPVSKLFEKVSEKESSKETPSKAKPPPGCEALPQKNSADLWKVAECFFKQGAQTKAVEVLREVSRKNPHDLDAYFTASWMLWTQGQNKGGETEKEGTAEALAELDRAQLANPTHWEVFTERGDFYFLRLNSPTKAYAEYIKARALYGGDYSRNVPKAENGRRAAIEDRIARTTEKLDRKGEAVEASCRALFFDPDDKGARERIERLFGSCTRKKVKDPRKSSAGSQEESKPASD